MSFNEGTKILKLDLVGRLALEGGLVGNASHHFADVGELGQQVLATGTEALEFVARKQDEFAAITKAVQSLVGEKKPHAA